MANDFKDISLELIKERIADLEISGSHEVYRKLFSYLDLTSLNITDSEKSIRVLVDKVNNFPYSFPDLLNVAAICVFPRFVPIVRQFISVDEINIASVGGSFPTSQTFLENKIDECKRIMDKGADEIDIVISLGEFMEGNLDIVGTEIRRIKETIGCIHLKVILESGIIHKPELIYSASMIAMESGADFIKTSTGKAPVSATPEAAWVMCHAIKDYHELSKREVGFKPAGGISTKADALLYYSIVERILGKSWLVPDLFRIGASRLANDLLSTIEGRDVDYF